jgi:hypothetical protein
MMSALQNANFRNIIEGIVEVICYGDDLEEIKNSIVQIMSAWFIYLSQAKNRLEELGVK